MLVREGHFRIQPPGVTGLRTSGSSTPCSPWGEMAEEGSQAGFSPMAQLLPRDSPLLGGTRRGTSTTTWSRRPLPFRAHQPHSGTLLPPGGRGRCVVIVHGLGQAPVPQFPVVTASVWRLSLGCRDADGSAWTRDGPRWSVLGSASHSHPFFKRSPGAARKVANGVEAHSQVAFSKGDYPGRPGGPDSVEEWT